MANPNIVEVSTIFGKTQVLSVTTTATAIVTNPVGSGKILKVNTLIVANVDGTNACDLTADVFRASVAYKLASTISVPPDASLVAISKDSGIYLEEGDTLRLTASANSDLQAICSYEEIS